MEQSYPVLERTPEGILRQAALSVLRASDRVLPLQMMRQRLVVDGFEVSIWRLMARFVKIIET